MTAKQQFETVMTKMVNMALATSVADRPNVRIVTFAYDAAKEGRLFFTTFKGNQKIREFEQNPQVACMPLSSGDGEDVQVRIFGRVQKADITVNDIISIIAKKYPDGAETIREGGEMLAVYEVCFEKIFLTVGMNEAQEISF